MTQLLVLNPDCTPLLLPTNTSIGRISSAGFISDQPIISSTRDTASSSITPAPPESVLFRRKAAPTRYEESDPYFANEDLPADALPESDLLKALHCYASDFYARATPDGGTADWRSMDETALLAMGILMEEVCRESLGETGDLVFTEGETREEAEAGNDVKRAGSVIKTSEAAAKSGQARRGKRRKIDVEATIEVDD